MYLSFLSCHGYKVHLSCQGSVRLIFSLRCGLVIRVRRSPVVKVQCRLFVNVSQLSYQGAA